MGQHPAQEIDSEPLRHTPRSASTPPKPHRYPGTCSRVSRLQTAPGRSLRDMQYKWGGFVWGQYSQ